MGTNRAQRTTERDGLAAELARTNMALENLQHELLRQAFGRDEVWNAENPAVVIGDLVLGPGFAYSKRLPVNALNENGRGLFIVQTLTRYSGSCTTIA